MEEKRVFVMNKYEYNLLLNVLNEYRNQLIKEEKSTDLVNGVLLRMIDAPMQKKSLFKRERVSFER